MQRKILLIAVALVVIAGATVLFPTADADTVQDQTYYCYGDNPTMVPHFNDENAVWTATYEDGSSTTLEANEDGTVSVNLSGHDRVRVVQQVGDSTAIATLIAMHLVMNDVDGDGKYLVTFHNDGEVTTYEITTSTVVPEGGVFAILPEISLKDGYEFGGWFTTPTFQEGTEFDNREPIQGNVDVYAKWVSTTPGSDGGSTVINVGNHLVTFDCISGLTYDIVDSGGSSVSFTVSPANGFSIDPEDVRVTANGTALEPVDGIYTVSDIRSDVLVEITGDMIFDHDPNGPEETGGIPMWMWLIVLVVILLIAAAVLWMRGRQEERRE